MRDREHNAAARRAQRATTTRNVARATATPARRSGLTIVECLLAVTILASAFLAVTYTVVAGQQHVVAGDRTARAARLARDLLEEICSKSYADPQGRGSGGPEADEANRAAFDDVDDYDGFVEQAGTLRDAAGMPYGDAEQAFSRRATVRPANQDVPALGLTFYGVTATVTVTHRSGETWSFQRFIPQP